jgi:protein TonB
MILKTDILDIIFEKRNKLYGAYSLRKFYPNRLKLSLGFMFIIALGMVAFTLLPDKAKRVVGRIYDHSETTLSVVDIITPAKPPEVPQPPKTTASSLPPVNQKIFTSKIEIVDKTEKTEKINSILPSDNIGTENIDNAKAGPLLIVPDKTETGNGVAVKSEVKPEKKSPMDLDMVDVPPSYPGGMDALRKFLEKNLRTPEELESGQTVSVRIKFVVDYNGKLQSFVTVLDGREAYNKEVIRVLKKMPDWIPGKARGENVPVYFSIPVKFVAAD